MICRFLIFLLGLGCLGNVHAELTPYRNLTNKSAVVFIHGNNDHRTDALINYWDPAFLAKVTKNLPNKDHVLAVQCNFRQYMWHKEAADCVAEQISDFIDKYQINDLMIITHSAGGVFIRWILSHPSYHVHYKNIIENTRWVIAIAPSSLGTPVADYALKGSYFEQTIGWLFGYKEMDSVDMQRMAAMMVYNGVLLYGTEHRPSLPVPFYSIVGTDVAASPFNSDNYCNGYKLNLELKLVKKMFLGTCSDGLLNCDSQSGAGERWFYDVDKTKGHKIINHSQSRNDCAGLADILANEIQ